MKPARMRSLPAWALASAILAVAGVLLAQTPLTQDADGDVLFRTPNDTVIRVAPDGEVSIDGRVLINCRQQPGSEVDLAVGKAECRGVIEVEDRYGNELEVYPTHAEAETDDGDKYELWLDKSPATKLDLSGDWRGAYGSADVDSILAELGATQQGDLIRLALAGDVLFDFDSSAIRPDAAEQLANAAHVIRQRSVGEVYVVGHTDSVGSDDYNRRLSRERAEAVVGWLSRHEGIPDSVMVSRGMGSAQPVAHNAMPDGSDDPAGRARNRRVEILLATREGVDLADVAGLVRVGEREVEVAGGAVRVDDGGVRVGGVEVTAGGVKIGGVTVGTGGITTGGGRVVDDEAPASCKRGEVCSLVCPTGDCNMTCESGAQCTFTCTGGDCKMRCALGADCDFQCTGGDCSFGCAVGSTCRTSCTGGGCYRS